MAISPDFENELEQERKGLLRKAQWLTRNPDDAEDLVQETYLQAVDKSHTFRPGTNLRAWLHKVQVNRHISNKKRTSRRAHEAMWPEAYEEIHTLTSHDLTSQSAEHIAERREQRRRIVEILAPLPLRQRGAVYLVDVMGFSYKEASEVLAIPKGSLSSSLHRGRATLRGLITDSRQI